VARADERDELSRLSDLIDTLRAKGIIKYAGIIPGSDRLSNVEMLFGPPVPVADGKKAEVDPRAPKRAHYMNLLGRTHIPDAELDMLPDAS